MSYVLGSTDTRFATFITACLGSIPVCFVEVYFGAVAGDVAKVSGNVSEHSTLHTVLTIAGLVVSVALLVYVTRLATPTGPGGWKRIAHHVLNHER